MRLSLIALLTGVSALALPALHPHTISILLYADPDCHTEPRALDVEPEKCYRFSGAQGAEVLSEDTGEHPFVFSCSCCACVEYGEELGSEMGRWYWYWGKD
jgi:hypothetical protein